LIAAALCLVVAISDGDTLKVRCGESGTFQQLTVRLAEIDAPEKVQPFGRRSTASLAALCFGAVATIKPEKRDQYGRTVARVECRGKDASLEQVRTGYAWYFARYGADAAIRRAEGLARGSNLGLWSDPAPVAPWHWRAAKRAR
jgi:endonuclease YncB( thermonuclease family)